MARPKGRAEARAARSTKGGLQTTLPFESQKNVHPAATDAASSAALPEPAETLDLPPAAAPPSGAALPSSSPSPTRPAAARRESLTPRTVVGPSSADADPDATPSSAAVPKPRAPKRSKRNRKTERVAEERAGRTQPIAIANAKSRKWSLKDVKLLVQKRREGVSYERIAEEHLPERTWPSCQSKFDSLPKDVDGNVRWERLRPDEDADAAKEYSPASAGGSDDGGGDAAQDAQVAPANVARMFIALNESFRNAAPLFPMLVASDFSDLSQSIQDWRAATAFKATVGARIRHPLPLAQMAVLALNQHLSNTAQLQGDAVGRFRCDAGAGPVDLVYLADRAWTASDAQEHERAAPRIQLQWSGPYIPWQWSHPRTKVLPILLVASHSEPDDDCAFLVSVPRTMWDAAAAGRADDSLPLVVLLHPDRAYFASLSDLIECWGGATRYGTHRGYVRTKKHVSIVWLPRTAERTWEKGSRLLPVSGSFTQDFINRALFLHRRLRDGKGSKSGVMLRDWTDVLEDLFPGN